MLNSDLARAVKAASPGMSRRQELRSPWPGLGPGSQLKQEGNWGSGNL